MARYLVVGGGIIGVAVARRLLQVWPDADVTVWEKEPEVARHQSGHNSGVVHAGLYYEPGSLKARLCRRGVALLRDFTDAQGLEYREIGKVLVSLDAGDEARLDAIEARARANGVPGVRRLSVEQLAEIEPHVRGVGGLHSPSTAIVDFAAITRALAADVDHRGGRVVVGRAATGVAGRTDGVVVEGLSDGEAIEEPFDRVVLCAGLHSDRLAVAAGDRPDPRIVPFRGEFHLLRPSRRRLVNGLVYPVPDPRLPFLGVHLTPRLDGEVLIGPNAVVALAREGYRRTSFDARDAREIARSPEFRRFSRRHWRTGVREQLGSMSRTAFVAAARRYLPELKVADVVSGPTGVRAQAIAPDGSLVDDFVVHTRGRVVALRNAPSPAATSSLAIAEHLVESMRDG